MSKKQNPWLLHLAKVKEENENLSHKEVMSLAKDTYVKLADKTSKEGDGDAPDEDETPAKKSAAKGNLKGKKLKDKATKLGITVEDDDKESVIALRVKCREAGISYHQHEDEKSLTERLDSLKEDQKKRANKLKGAEAADKLKGKADDEAEEKYGLGEIMTSLNELIAHPDLKEKPSILGQLRQAAHKLKTAKELLRGA